MTYISADVPPAFGLAKQYDTTSQLVLSVVTSYGSRRFVPRADPD